MFIVLPFQVSTLILVPGWQNNLIRISGHWKLADKIVWFISLSIAWNEGHCGSFCPDRWRVWLARNDNRLYLEKQWRMSENQGWVRGDLGSVSGSASEAAAKFVVGRYLSPSNRISCVASSTISKVMICDWVKGGRRVIDLGKYFYEIPRGS